MDKIDKDGIDPLVEPVEDKVHRIISAATGLVPGGQETFLALIEPPMEKRKNEWMIRVTETLNELIDKHKLDIGDLASNEEFISILVQTSQTALKTHKSEKLERLKNILTNSVDQHIHYDKKVLFITYVDQLSEYHMAMLKFVAENYSSVADGNSLEYDDCERHIEANCGLEDLTIAAYLRSQLEDMHFLDSETIDGKGYMKLSDFGSEFYSFIYS